MVDFGSLITAMVTPFDDKGNIDWNQTALLIDELIENQQTDSLVICGTTGESPTLDDTEKLAMFKFAVEHAAGRCKIIAGTGSNNTAHSIHLTKEAELCGVDAVLLVTPYYNKPNQEGLFRHFEAIASATKLPVMLYNVPSRTVVGLSAATTLRLAQIPNVVATKECGPLDQLAGIVSGAPNDFIVYTGDDSSALPALAVGARGIVSVASHIVGKSMKQMISSYLQGNVQEAGKLYRELLPLFKVLFECPNPVGVKYALGEKGLNVGSVRLPLVPPSEDEAMHIRNLLQ
ncbi:4-hydroxy-tetrahydrodipicolinate synthase [Paenibacillus puldeungensis]|uniref:4-hydroxy-tetrahydrodipicolinate synthase n=1 Tax=Paenibacillus puldeungensis TaxID=696536 RepID=A0ABW3RZ89_9BACL